MKNRDNTAKPLTRRDLFLKGASRAAAVGAALSIGSRAARAAGGGGIERALVGIQLLGGADSNNLLVPLDPAQYASYAQIRGPLALPREVLLPISATGGQADFGLNPAAAELYELYQLRALALVANVGSLMEPTTRDQCLAGSCELPSDLREHIGNWMAYLPNGFFAPEWTVKAASPEYDQETRNLTAPTLSEGLGQAESSANAFTFDTGLSLTTPDPISFPGGRHENPTLNEAAAPVFASLANAFPQTYLGIQLQQAASLIWAAGEIGMRRLAFTSTLSGFDIHSEQPGRQDWLLGELSSAAAALYAVTSNWGIADRVTTYTDSEFNRTLQPNARGGTEHAWGGHQIAIGGSVLGGALYGRMPILSLGGPDDVDVTGIWAPTIARDQYYATFAFWYSGSYSTVAELFPRIHRFDRPTLDFLV